MNNLSSYCGLVDAKMRTFDRFLPVPLKKNLNYTFFVLSDVITRDSVTVLSEKKGESLLVIEFSIKEYKIDFELVFICINLNSIFFVLSDVIYPWFRDHAKREER